MPTTSTETVRLDLEGTFAAMAKEDEQAAVKLAAGLDRLGTSSARVQAPKLGGTGGSIKDLEKQIAGFEIAPQLERKRMLLEKQLAGMKDSMRKSLEPPKVDASWIGGAKGEAEGLGEKFAGVGGMAGGGLGIAAAGLAAITALAYKAAGAVYDLGKSFVELGIKETSKAEIQRDIFKKLGGDYDVAIKLAGKYGLDGDVAVADVRKLLKAKFSQAQIDVDMKIVAGLGAVEGDEMAKGYIQKMAQAANKGKKANEEIIKGFAEVGIDTEKVYAKLAQKMGISIAMAKAKVKGNAVEMKDALDAVRAAADGEFGGMGAAIANSVPALLMRVKMGISQLFTGFNLDPLRDALKNASELLEGPEGKLLKGAFSEAGSEIVKTLFGPFQGAEGKARMISIMAELVAILHMVRDAAKAAAPAVKLVLDMIAHPAEKGQGLAGIVKGQKKSHDLAGPGMMTEGVDKLFGKVGPAANDSLVRSLDFSPIFDQTKSSAMPIGDAVSEGMAEAIASNPDAVAAAAAMSEEVLATVRQRLGVASPSKEGKKLGAYFNQGFGEGAENDNSAADAGQAIAAQAMGGVAGGAGGGGAGGGGGGGAPSLQITNVWPAGVTPEQGSAVAAANAEEWRRQMRAWEREKMERVA